MCSWITREADLLPGDLLAGASRATVFAGGAQTAYVRMGRGAPLLFLRGRRDLLPISGELIRSLVEDRFSLIVPQTIAAIEPVAATGIEQARLGFSTWLRDFLDGLGIERTGLIAEPELGLSALAFAMSMPQRVSLLAMLVTDPPGLVSPTELLPDRLENGGCPLLIVWLGAPDGGGSVEGRWGRTVTEIGAFLRQGSVQPVD